MAPAVLDWGLAANMASVPFTILIAGDSHLRGVQPFIIRELHDRNAWDIKVEVFFFPGADIQATTVNMLRRIMDNKYDLIYLMTGVKELWEKLQSKCIVG